MHRLSTLGSNSNWSTVKAAEFLEVKGHIRGRGRGGTHALEL